MRQREVAAREAAATLFRPRRSGGRRAGRRVVGRRWKDKKARKKDCLDRRCMRVAELQCKKIEREELGFHSSDG